MQVKEPSFVTIEGRRMAYDEVKPTNPQGVVLLLTGLGSKRLGWYKQLEEFGRTYRTIALDHRDTGDSDYATASYKTADQADDAAAVLHALNIPKAYVIGISMGGFIALELTLRHPQLVEKLVLVATSAGGPTHVQPGPEMLMMLARQGNTLEIGELGRQTYSRIMHPDFVKTHSEELERIAQTARYKPQSPAAYGRQLQTALSYNTAPRLSQITVPTLVVHGEYDPLVPVGNGRFLAQHIGGAKLILYPATGHIPIIERAEQFNRDVLEFLGGRGQRSGFSY